MPFLMCSRQKAPLERTADYKGMNEQLRERISLSNSRMKGKLYDNLTREEIRFQ